ncbi:MAG: hypothetical protein HC777_03015, partial [Hyphomonadaceae bacterium]|nr:hypothetical protein [Hyphomonadaceae bacterium]
MGCTDWRRTAFFNAELVAAIRVQAAGHVSPDHFIGSWAGAFGQTQAPPRAAQFCCIARQSAPGFLQDTHVVCA